MPATEGIVVHGLADLNRAFKNAERAARLENRHALREIGKPVAETAQQLAGSRIRNIGDAWSQMRVGVTLKVVYVAPRQRGSKGRGGLHRPNLAGLLMDRAMQPALDRNLAGIERSVDEYLDDVERVWERT